MKHGALALIGIVLMGLPLAASAEYFFAANDVVVSKCEYTDLSGKSRFEKMLESSSGLKCDAMEDKEQTIVVTCRAALRNVLFATKSRQSCESLRDSVSGPPAD